MSRLIFCALAEVACTAALAAQAVPGRDLLEFPVGTIAEAPALAIHSSHGLWNPAATLLTAPSRGRIIVGALDAASDLGLSEQLIAVSAAIPGKATVSLSLLRASIGSLVRTDGDPQSIGEITYSTMLLSASIARRNQKHFITGIALRYRSGEIDGDRRGSLGIDGGILADDLPWRHARIGLSTFLWRPAPSASERTRYSVAADFRVAGADSLHEVRTGYSFAFTGPGVRQHYVVVGGRLRGIELLGGVVRENAYGRANWHERLGIGVHHARYTLGIAREDPGAGLRPVYQFTLSSTMQ